MNHDRLEYNLSAIQRWESFMIHQLDRLIFLMKKQAWWGKVTNILNRLSGGVDST